MRLIKYFVFFCLLLWGAVSCTEMDDYLQYTSGKEILYTGKLDSAMVFSGDGRVVLTGLLISDPKITRIKIYWNNDADSLVMDVERSAGVDTLYVPIELPEGAYNFEVYTFDNEGHASIPVYASGVSYGSEYKKSLYNRVIKKAEKVGDDVIIDWYNGDATSPFVQINYTDLENTDQTVKVTNDSSRTVLQNFKSMTKFRMQTYFLPNELAIDTFRAEPVLLGVDENVTNIFIKNPGNPFLRSDDGDGKWGLLQDWEYTPNVINQNGETAGGWSWDGNPSGVIHFESKDWGGEGVTNGKIYQSFELAAGNYVIEMYSDGGGSGGPVDANFLVAKGTVLPDIDALDPNPDVLGIYRWNEHSMGGTNRLSFALEEPTVVVVGWVASFGSYTWMHINYVKLMRLAE